MTKTNERREVVRECPRRLLPAFGHKGGERVEKEEVRTSRIEDR